MSLTGQDKEFLYYIAQGMSVVEAYLEAGYEPGPGDVATHYRAYNLIKSNPEISDFLEFQTRTAISNKILALLEANEEALPLYLPFLCGTAIVGQAIEGG